MHAARTLTALVAALAPSLVFAQTIPVDAAIRAFHEAQALSDADHGRLWGCPLAGPMLFVDPASREVVCNSADPQGVLRPSGAGFVGKLPEEKGVANTSLDWLGTKWTMVMWPLPESRYARGRLLMHESFHRVQDSLGLPASNPANNHLDSANGRIWLQLEWRALSEALIRTGAQRRQAVADAIAFRAHRRSLCPGAAEPERGLEMNEGLAEYTGYRTCGLPEAVLPDRVAARLDQQQGGSGFVRNFAYVSGPAYGLLLDAVDPDWRKGLTPERDLGELLRTAMNFGEPASTEAALMGAADRYDGRSVIDAENKRESRRQEQLARYKAQFFDGPALVLPVSPAVNYTYDPNGVEAYDDTASVYPSVRVVDTWGILEVAGGGALLVRRDGRIAEIRVRAPQDPHTTPVRGDGWTLRPASGWSMVPGQRPGDLAVAFAPK